MTRIRLSALPAKRVLTNKAAKYTADLAIFELVDNAVDGWRRRKDGQPLAITLSLGGAGAYTTLSVQDNAGGVAVDDLERLVKAGAENPDPDSIGVWGEGIKVAAYSLASHAVFRTRYGDGPTYRIVLDDTWWNSPDWDVYAERDDDDLPPGSMEVRLEGLRRPLSEEEVFGAGQSEEGNDLVSKIGRVYARLLDRHAGAINLEIVANRKQATVRPSRFGSARHYASFFAFPPGMEPTEHHVSFGPRQELRLKVVVGLMPEQDRDHSGVTMYGKGRLFAFGLKEGSVGFGTRGPAKIPASHPTTWRLVLLCDFEGPSRMIPWQSPAKWGYDENNPFAADIHAFLQKVAEPYAAFTRTAKRLDLLPHSEKWNHLSMEERAREVDRFGIRPAEADPLLTQAFRPMELHAVSHDRDEGERKVRELLSTAKNATRLFRDRERQGKKASWGAPGSDAIVVPALARGEPDDVIDPTKEWRNTERTTISFSPALRRFVEERFPELTVPDWLRMVGEREAARHEPIFSIPQAEYRRPVEAIRQIILDALPDAKGVLLFGSVASGNADRKSDVDILVVHDEDLLAQGRLSRALGSFSHLADRYKVNPQAIREDTLRRRFEADARFKEMLASGLWLHVSSEFQPPSRRRTDG